MNLSIYTEIRDRILYIDYAPGQILNEQTLAKEFGVSRTPLRVVLLRLEWEQLIKILPRTGILVAELEMNTIMNVFQARIELEEVIGRLASQRLPPDTADRLAALLSEIDTVTLQKNPRALASVDTRIKEMFYEAAGNPFLAEMSSRLYALTFRLWYFNLIKMDNMEWSGEVLALKEELTDLVDVILADKLDAIGLLRKDQLLKHLKRIRATFLGLSSGF